MGIGAVIFDFNGVLVDDESVHCALFSEVLAQEGVTLSEKDYHERYLGYDDRKCFETVLVDSQKPTSPDYLDRPDCTEGTAIYRVCHTRFTLFPRSGRNSPEYRRSLASGHLLGGASS